MPEGWGPHLRRSPPQSGGLSLQSTSLSWPTSCVLSILIRRNRDWGWGQWSKMAGCITAPGRGGCPNEHSNLGWPGRGGRWPSRCLAVLPTPLAGPSGAHVALWEHFPAFFFFFFSNFISSDSWLLQPYGVLPTAAVQAMWHFGVSNFIFTSIDKESGRSGEGQCSPAGWPHVRPEGRAPSHAVLCVPAFLGLSRSPSHRLLSVSLPFPG